MLSAWIFDLDDTLYPEREYVHSGFRAVGEWAENRLGLSPTIVQAQLEALFDGGFRRDAFQWWLSEQGQPASLLPEMVDIYRRHKPRINCYPDSVQVLDALKPRFRLGLITEGRQAAQEAKIQVLGLRRWIEAVIILGETDREEWKPCPRSFRRMLAMLSLTEGEAAYVGDNPGKDFRGARAAGMYTVRIRREGGLHADAEPASAEDAPDREIHSLADLLEIRHLC
ncbi:MAG: HAD family hydrolase [Anaerolineales bacterium]